MPLLSVRHVDGTNDKCHFRTISCFVILGFKVFLNNEVHQYFGHIDTYGSKLIRNHYLDLKDNRANTKRSASLLLIISGV